MHFLIDPPDLQITGDAEGIFQLLYNLLDNAVKFTPFKGSLGLTIRRCGDERVEFTVWDTGIGIAEEQQGRIFDAFTQADNGLAWHHDGIGLGLAFTQRMATMLGGDCTVQSTPGSGSRFIVTLPIQPMLRG